MNPDYISQDLNNASDSESSEATVLSSNESSLSDSISNDCEVAKILNNKFQLPKELCESREIFEEIFSLSTWNELSASEQENLIKLLPDFPENSRKEKETTIHQLFSKKITRFGETPFDKFHTNLQDGNYRPDIAHYRKRILKEEERDQRIRECERISMLAEKLVVSREKLLRSAYSSENSIPFMSDDKISRSNLSATIAAMRGNKRYFQELLKIFDDLNYSFSDDETMPNRSHLQFTKKQIKQFNEQEITGNGSELRIIGTTSTKQKNWDHMTDSTILSNKYKQILRNYRKRKTIEPDHAEMEIEEIKLRDVISRSTGLFNSKKFLLSTHNVSNKNLFISDLSRIKQEIPGKNQLSKVSFRNICKIDVLEKPLKLGSQNETDEEDFIKANIIKVETNENTTYARAMQKIDQKIQKPQYKLKIPYQQSHQLNSSTNANNRKRNNLDCNQTRVDKKIIIDTGGIIKSSPIIRETISQNSTKRKICIENAGFKNFETVKSPELTAETQNCFLSLIRDIFCSTTEHRMKLEELRKRVNVWLKNPIAPTNTWYKDVDQWGNLIISAVHFLSGEFLDQPQHFVPYLEFKSQMNIYQWIGAGRDNDVRMLNLNQYWLSRHNDMGIKASSSLKQKSYTKISVNPENNESNYLLQSLSPPNQRCKSNWKIKPASKSEILEFQAQEQKRFESPNLSFIYTQHGYESTVGPLRDMHLPVSVITKARDNNILLPDRPNYVTTVAIVRDAIARLPNGEGTFDEICELVKCSKFLTYNLNENVVKSYVSMALDNISSEIPDPTAKFDNKRKLWVYMHRNRTEADFERIQQQSDTKPKKTVYRKINQNDNSLTATSNSIKYDMQQMSNAITFKISKLKDSDQNHEMSPIATLSSPLLITSPKKFVKTAHNEKSMELLDVEASLDAHTTPIVRTSDTKPNRVMLKTTSQLASLQANSVIVNTNRSQSPKITTVLTSKKVVSKPSNNEITKPNIQLGLKSSSNYVISLKSSNGDKGKSVELQTKPSISPKHVVTVNANANTDSQQSPKLIVATASPNLAQKSGKNISLPRTPMLSQQKQILTNVIVQQQKAKSGQNTSLSSGKNCQKTSLPTASSCSTSSTAQSQHSSLLAASTSTSSPKQTVFQLSQLKQLKHDGTQQTMVLKPQLLKNMTNDLPAPPLVVNKIIRPTNPIIQTSQINTSTAQKISTGATNNQVFARVVSAGGRQLIDGILPKNSTTFKLASNTGGQQNMLQLSGSQQYTVISKGKNILSQSAKMTTSKANTATQNVLVTSHSNSNSNQSVGQVSSSSTSASTSSIQPQPLKLVQSGTITAQQLINAKLINVQTLGNKGFKPTGGIKMISTQGYLTNIGGVKPSNVPIIIAGKNSNTTKPIQNNQGIVLQANPAQNNTFILNTNQTTFKMQGSILSQPQQTVVLGKQVIKVQAINQPQKALSTEVKTSATETVLLAPNKTQASKSSTNQDEKQTSNGQQIILGSSIKVLKNMIAKPNSLNPQTTRVVLAPSSGNQNQFTQQIILPANFQGIKTIQGLKVVQQARFVSNSHSNSTGSNNNKQQISKQDELTKE